VDDGEEQSAKFIVNATEDLSELSWSFTFEATVWHFQPHFLKADFNPQVPGVPLGSEGPQSALEGVESE